MIIIILLYFHQRSIATCLKIYELKYNLFMRKQEMHFMLINVPNERLSDLTKERAVDLIEELVHIDASESGIPLDIISFSSEIDTPDGGIDGKVDGSDKKSKMGTIKKGITCYQIKSGGQRPSPSTIKKILRANNGKGPLKPGIKSCFDKDGTLVMVFTGVDTPAQSIDKVCSHPEKYIPEYKNARLKIWTQAHLRQFLKPHPRLSLQILGIDDKLFCPYQEWASQEYMRNEIFLGTAQRNFINTLQQKLPTRSTKHIRVIGEPGIGKTRLVLETLRAQFSDSCLYIDNPRIFLESKLFRYITTKKDKSLTILVVDECEEAKMVEIWNRVKHIPQISLITIYNESGYRMRDMINIEVPPLEDRQIKEILKSYIPSDYADIWYKECRPSPRAAHIIGDNLKHNTGDVLQPPSDVRVWDRYIASQTEMDSPEFKERKKILLWLSLFKNLGERESYPDEYKIIEKILKDKVGILPATLSQTIAKLKRTKILQGSSMLYITPKVLHVWLRRQWDKEYDKGLFPLDEITNMAKTDMACSNVLEWYMDTFKYADYTSDMGNITNDFFKPDGFVDRHALLDSHKGADLFYSASKADPEKAVDYLYRHVTSKDGLLEFNVGQRQAVMVLSDAVMDRRLFEKSARMLLLLAAGESRQSISDADRLFVNLFLPAPGSVGWTAMPPSGRLPLIREALDSDISECRLLGIRACETALHTQYFIKNIDDDEAWQRTKPWMPKFRSEYTEYYAGVLHIIRERLEYLEGPERSKLAEVVLSRTWNMLAIPEMHDTVLSLLDMIYSKQYVRNESLIKTITDCIAYGRDGMPAYLRKNLEQLRDKVTGSSYSALLERYVSMNIPSDHLDESNLHQKTIEKLAEQSLELKRLESELGWLVTDKAVYGHWFGRALGKIDGGALFSRIYNAQRQHKESKAAFLGGYLYAVFQRNVEEWEDLMDLLAKDDILHSRVPALTHMSGMTDRAAVRIRDLVISGLDPAVLKDFVFGTMVRCMSEERFAEWLQLLADGNAKTYETALNLYHTYYVHDDMRIPDSVSKLLFPSNDVEGAQIVSIRSDHDWSDILAAYTRQNSKGLDMVERELKIILGSYLNIHRYDKLLPALMVAAEIYPTRTWEIISGFIDPAKNKPGVYYNVKSLLSLNGAALASGMPLDAIFEWTDKDKARRAPLVAYLIPSDINTITKFAAKYGKIKNVARILQKNLTSKPINGSVSEYHKKEIKEVDLLMKKENDTLVLEFLQKYKDYLEANETGLWP